MAPPLDAGASATRAAPQIWLGLNVPEAADSLPPAVEILYAIDQGATSATSVNPLGGVCVIPDEEAIVLTCHASAAPVTVVTVSVDTGAAVPVSDWNGTSDKSRAGSTPEKNSAARADQRVPVHEYANAVSVVTRCR